MKDRNLNPTAEALYAMALWNEEYAAQGGGCMDFFDNLRPAQKKQCEEDVSRIKNVWRWRGAAG